MFPETTQAVFQFRQFDTVKFPYQTTAAVAQRRPRTEIEGRAFCQMVNVIHLCFFYWPVDPHMPLLSDNPITGRDVRIWGKFDYRQWRRVGWGMTASNKVVPWIQQIE